MIRISSLLGHASVQGMPSNDRLAFGVPSGGAFDPFALRWANRLVGNSEDALGLELAGGPLSIEVTSAVILAWAGGPLVVTQGAKELRSPARIGPGERVDFLMSGGGCRRWIAFSGGLKAEPGITLKKGQAVPIEAVGSSELIGTMPFPEIPGDAPFRMIPSHPAFQNLFGNVYQVGHEYSRVGIRLQGARMRHKLELPSEPAVMGVVQITPEGLPIIFGPDGPTIGGYPKAGVVASVDWARLGQLQAGDHVAFKRITVAAAQALAAEKREYESGLLGNF